MALIPRAESFYNVATQEDAYADWTHPSARYHEKSHGESFLALAQGNLQPNGLNLFEVQLLGEFESVLNNLIHLKNVDVYVTGSNARFLSKDVITEFREQNRTVGTNICFMVDYRLS